MGFGAEAGLELAAPEGVALAAADAPGTGTAGAGGGGGVTLASGVPATMLATTLATDPTRRSSGMTLDLSDRNDCTEKPGARRACAAKHNRTFLKALANTICIAAVAGLQRRGYMPTVMIAYGT